MAEHVTNILCKDCVDAKRICTGSTIWIVCPVDGRWRTPTATCNKTNRQFPSEKARVNQSKIPNQPTPIIQRFLNQQVIIKIDGAVVEGALIYADANVRHNPAGFGNLILKAGSLVSIVRGCYVRVICMKRKRPK